jgi:hypothetical protein
MHQSLGGVLPLLVARDDPASVRPRRRLPELAGLAYLHGQRSGLIIHRPQRLSDQPC